MDEKMLNELKKIRELLEPKPAPPAPAPPKGLWNEFVDFISKYKVMGLAVAFILGFYLGGLVQALVKDFVMPLIGLVIPGMQTFDVASCGWHPTVWTRRLPICTDNLHHRCLRNLHFGKSNQEIGHRISS